MTIFANDRALLDRFRRGARAALAAVYERYVDEVATLARRGFTIESSGHVYVRGTGRDGEYEITQETFARAFAEKARLAYDGLQPYRPYLLRITKNLMIDRFRVEQKLVELDAASIDAALPPAEEPVELHWKTLFEAATAYVATLDAEHRQFVTLRFEDACSQDETAAHMKCTRRRVRTLERDVQDGLRTWLKSRGLLER